MPATKKLTIDIEWQDVEISFKEQNAHYSSFPTSLPSLHSITCSNIYFLHVRIYIFFKKSIEIKEKIPKLTIKL